MVSILSAVQYVGILILLFEIFYIIRQRPSKSQILLLMVVICELVNFAGYIFEINSTTLEQSLTAVKFMYIGKPFIVLSMFFFIMDFFRVKIPHWSKIILTMFHISITALVMTCEKQHLYYTSIDFTNEGLFPHLIFGHGIFYFINIALTIFYFIVIIITGIKKNKNAVTKTEKNLIKYLIAIEAVAITGLIVFLSGKTRGYDTTSPAYLIATIGLLFTMYKYRIFDTTVYAKDFVIDNYDGGLIVFDNNNNVTYANNQAAEVFPEIIGKNCSSTIQIMDNALKNNQKIFSNENVYSISVQSIEKNNIVYGKMYILKDITASHTYTQRLKKDVEEKTKEIATIQHSVIASFANMIEARDGVTGQHIKNTSEYVKIIATALRKKGAYPDILTDEYTKWVIEAAPLHDLGKISIPDYVLKKPAKLTDEEFAIIKTHPVVGAKLIDEILSGLENSDYLKVAREVAYYHHEKWNGKGYPTGISGEQIPLCARIMAIADVYDALRSKRSYKEGFSKEKSREIIVESSGSHFDPQIVEVFLENIDEIESVQP